MTSYEDRWNPADYEQYSSGQQKWAQDIIKILNIESHHTILDIGCGDGKITTNLCRYVPHGFILGIDNSPSMIDYTQKIYRLL